MSGKTGSSFNSKGLQWTEAQRANARNYCAGLVVQFHQNVPGFRRGERMTVRQADEQGVQVGRGSDKATLLPLDEAARFQVYESRQIALAPGEMIRITQNGFTKDRRRLNNGDLRQVKGFAKDGDIILVNGWVIPKDYGHLTYGYCVTSYGAQSKGVDCVFIAESSESFRAADREQFYVSASRFKEALTIYTDDKRQLLAAISKSSERPSATDLVIKQADETTRLGDSKKGLAQRQSAEKNLARAQSESQARRCETVPVRRRHPVDGRVRQSQSKGITR